MIGKQKTPPAKILWNKLLWIKLLEEEMEPPTRFQRCKDISAAAHIDYDQVVPVLVYPSSSKVWKSFNLGAQGGGGTWFEIYGCQGL